jgi:hydrogenase nickel incorporation protein HypA/HybF
MHEMSLAEGISQIIEDAARREAFRQVRRLRLEIGQLANVEREALGFALEVVLRGGIAGQAVIEMLEAPGRGWCFDCDAEVSIGSLLDPCPRCGGYGVRATGGTEMRVVDLEVE